MTEIEKLRQDLFYVVKSMQEHPEEWEANGVTTDAQPHVSELFDMAEAIEEELEGPTKLPEKKPDRKALVQELRLIEGSYEQEITKEKQLRARQIIKQLQECICRNCAKVYQANKARGDWTGFCSAKCQHEMAKKLGFRKGKGKTEYQVLRDAKAIGSVYAIL